ncbi:TnpA family transposase [Sphingobium sp. OAS761]|nr:TnpA family transposase [Sphingobium sp. OAS761]
MKVRTDRLNWLRDIDLRRHSQVGVNKGEAHNPTPERSSSTSFATCAPRRFENPIHRASGSNLLVTAIILWNTHSHADRRL